MPTIRRHPDRPGVQLLDPIEGVRYELYVAEDDVDVEQRPDDAVPVPVDAVARVTTRQLTLPKRLEVIVRDRSHQVVGTVDPDDPVVPDLPGTGPYLLEVTSAPLKLYLQVPGPFTVSARDALLDVGFDRTEQVDIAIRSFHERPAGTITVGDSVRDEMEAISRFGSALKTTSPERAWPTLRGHPPLVETGASFDVPDAVQRPATGVTLHVPPDREHIYPAAPLSYYLGARLEPTTGEPRLTAAGESIAIDGDDYTGDLNTLLRRVFVLDVAARTEGTYPFRVAAHDRIDGVVDGRVDWGRLFEAPIDERLAEYLAPRFDGVADESVLPDWHLTTDVAPLRSSLDYLPWVAKDLSLVRRPDEISPAERTAEPEPITAFLRSPDGEGGSAHGEGGSAHRTGREGSGRGAGATEPDLPRVRPSPVATPEHRWVGEEAPLEAQRADRDALHRHLSRYPPEQDDHVISIDFVCNDEAMTDEAVVEEVYGVRDLLEYDVRTHYGLTRGELRAVLRSPSDLLHYVGHVDDDGIHCVDGPLDVRTVESVGIDAFLLNACRSYHQGQALLDAGSLAGVVTLSRVGNVVATRMGRQLARLLNTGLRFRSALAILQDYVPVGYQYIVLGAGNLQLVQSESGCPFMTAVERRDDGRFELSLSYYPASGYDVGALVTPVLESLDRPSLGTGRRGPVVVDRDELLSFCRREEAPVDVGGELVWSSDIAMLLGGNTERPLEDAISSRYTPNVDDVWTDGGEQSTGRR